MPTCVETYRSSTFGEERLDHGGAVGDEDAGRDFYMMIEARVGEHFEAGAEGAAFGVVGAVDEARDTRLDDGACAHAAGLNSNVERSIGEAVVAEQAGGFAEYDDFGVGGGVAVADGAVAGASDDLAVMDEDRADGDFAACRCGAGFSECFLHELDVSFHLPRENNMRNEEKRDSWLYRIRAGAGY